MKLTSNRYRDYNGRAQRWPLGVVSSGEVRTKENGTENAVNMRSCAAYIKEQLAMSARVKMNTPAAAPAKTSAHTTEKQPAMSVCVNENTPIAAPVTASAYIEEHCASDIYICKRREQAGQYFVYHKAATSARGSAKASALGEQGRAISSYDQTASWGIVAL